MDAMALTCHLQAHVTQVKFWSPSASIKQELLFTSLLSSYPVDLKTDPEPTDPQPPLPFSGKPTVCTADTFSCVFSSVLQAQSAPPQSLGLPDNPQGREVSSPMALLSRLKSPLLVFA